MLATGFPTSFDLFGVYRDVFGHPEGKLAEKDEINDTSAGDIIVDKHGNEFRHLPWDSILEELFESIRKAPEEENVTRVKKLRSLLTFFTDNEIMETMSPRLENTFIRLCAAANKEDKEIFREIDRTIAILLLLNGEKAGDVYKAVAENLKRAEYYLANASAIFVGVEDDYNTLKSLFMDKEEWNSDDALASAFLTLSMEDSDLVDFLGNIFTGNHLSALVSLADMKDDIKSLLVIIFMLFIERIIDVIFENDEDESNEDVVKAQELLKKLKGNEHFNQILEFTTSVPSIKIPISDERVSRKKDTTKKPETKIHDELGTFYSASNEVLTLVLKGNYLKFKDSASITFSSAFSMKTEEILGVCNLFIFAVCYDIIGAHAIIALFGNESLRSLLDIERDPNDHDIITAHNGILLPAGPLELQREHREGADAKEHQKIRERQIAKRRTSKYGEFEE